MHCQSFSYYFLKEMLERIIVKKSHWKTFPERVTVKTISSEDKTSFDSPTILENTLKQNQGLLEPCVCNNSVEMGCLGGSVG